jgi:hypothetical protein
LRTGETAFVSAEMRKHVAKQLALPYVCAVSCKYCRQDRDCRQIDKRAQLAKHQLGDRRSAVSFHGYGGATVFFVAVARLLPAGRMDTARRAIESCLSSFAPSLFHLPCNCGRSHSRPSTASFVPIPVILFQPIFGSLTKIGVHLY